ncbi:MAG: DUF1737 domain-containing protein [Parvibaculales bacterium]
MTEKTTDTRKLYKLLTGTDDAAFCQRVSDHLADGYELYGPPLLEILPDGSVKTGQAVQLKTDKPISDQ